MPTTAKKSMVFLTYSCAMVQSSALIVQGSSSAPASSGTMDSASLSALYLLIPSLHVLCLLFRLSACLSVSNHPQKSVYPPVNLSSSSDPISYICLSRCFHLPIPVPLCVRIFAIYLPILVRLSACLSALYLPILGRLFALPQTQIFPYMLVCLPVILPSIFPYLSIHLSVPLPFIFGFRLSAL